MLKTEKCIWCLDQFAEVFTGHVIKNSEKITAGACRTHLKYSNNAMDKNGCIGLWLPEYGLLGEDQWPAKNNNNNHI